MNMSGFGYSRLQKINGVTLDVSFDPTQLTPRVRKAAQKLLRSKSIEGSGQAAKAALMAWSALDKPPAIMRGRGYVLNFREVPDAVRTEWRILIGTGRMVALADAANNDSWRREMIERDCDETLSMLDTNVHPRAVEAKHFYIGSYYYPDAVRDQLFEAFVNDSTNAWKYEAAAASLDHTAPIKPNMDLIATAI